MAMPTLAETKDYGPCGRYVVRSPVVLTATLIEGIVMTDTATLKPVVNNDLGNEDVRPSLQSEAPYSRRRRVMITTNQLDEFGRNFKKPEALLAAVRELAGCDPYADDDRLPWPVSLEAVTGMLQDTVDQLCDMGDDYEKLVDQPCKRHTDRLHKLACSIAFIKDVIETSGETMPSSSCQTVDILNVLWREVYKVRRKIVHSVDLAYLADKSRLEDHAA